MCRVALMLRNSGVTLEFYCVSGGARMRLFICTILFCFAAVMPSFAQSMDTPGAWDMQNEVSWCWNNQDGSLLQQGTTIPPRGVCGGYLVAGALSIFAAPEIAAFVGIDQVIGADGKSLARKAAELSCQRNPVADQAAVRLIHVCQCHNTRVVDFVENNQDVARYILRRHGGCEPLN